MTVVSIITVLVLLGTIVRVIVTIAPPPVREIPKGGIPRVGKPCGFDRPA